MFCSCAAPYVNPVPSVKWCDGNNVIKCNNEFHKYIDYRPAINPVYLFFLEDTLSPEDPLNSSHNSFTTRCQQSKVTQFITQHIKTAYLDYETAQEISYILPFEEAKKGNFQRLFDVRTENVIL